MAQQRAALLAGGHRSRAPNPPAFLSGQRYPGRSLPQPALTGIVQLPPLITALCSEHYGQAGSFGPITVASGSLAVFSVFILTAPPVRQGYCPPGTGGETKAQSHEGHVHTGH